MKDYPIHNYKQPMLYLAGICFLLIGALLPLPAQAGNLDSPAATTTAGSAMFTITDIYNRLNTGAVATPLAGGFTEPAAGPTAGTGHTLNEVMTLVNSRAPVAKTGQTTFFFGGSDGDLVTGVAWPNPRFTDNTNGTVTDNLTGLIWLKNANCFNVMTWAQAFTHVHALANNALCGLTDGSAAGDWRLPNIKELTSLVDFEFTTPALSNAAGTAKWTNGDAFTGVVTTGDYWSSTTVMDNIGSVWTTNITRGQHGTIVKSLNSHVWPVRGGRLAPLPVP